MGTALVTTGWANSLIAEVERGQAVADYAAAALRGAQIANRLALGYSPTYRSFVDGVQSTALAKVKLDGGRIDFEFDVPAIDATLLRWIAGELFRQSPHVRGDYQRGHIVLADGKLIDVYGPIPATAKEFIFTNSEPYARKIEIGTTESGRAFVIQVQPRIYERVGKAARSMFADRKVSILTEFRPLDIGAIKSWSGSAGAHRIARRRGGNPNHHADWLKRQPAIIVQAA